jgi:hypothetical protein
VEAAKDLVGDNPGPLAELWNLDKGCWVAHGAHRILVTMRFRVRLKRENRRVRRESVMEFEGKSVPKIRGVL